MRDSIALWLFATKCTARINNQDIDVLVINSFQGSLKTRYKRYQNKILEAVVQLLNENIQIPILACNHSFNSFNLDQFTDAKETTVNLVNIPNMRLDFYTGPNKYLMFKNSRLLDAA